MVRLHRPHKNSKCFLSIASQNIQGGFGSKIEFDDVFSFIKSHDINCFQETWLMPSNKLALPGYSIFRSDRRKSKRKHCGSGGVVVVYRTSLSKGLQKIKSENDDLIWIKLNKTFFGLNQDIYLGNCYIPPKKSELHDRNETAYFETLRNEVAKFMNLGNVLLCGDFNARLGRSQEIYKVIDSNDRFSNDRFDDLADKEELDVPHRYNEDLVQNTFGKELLSLLNETHLIIVNGRTVGDCFGSNTCYNTQGASTVDYFITDHSLFNSVLNMEVQLQTWYSDHSPLRLTLSIGRDIGSELDIGENLERVDTFKWDEEGQTKFTSLLNSLDTKKRFNDLLEKGHSNVNTLLSEFKEYNPSPKSVGFIIPAGR